MPNRFQLLILVAVIGVGGVIGLWASADEPAPWEVPSTSWKIEPLPNPDSVAKSEAEMKKYRETLSGTDIGFDMVAIPGGEFLMGSPEDEDDRGDDEGPRVKVAVGPFWMGACEVTWDEYQEFALGMALDRNKKSGKELSPWDALADAITGPTPEYEDITFGKGRGKRPAVNMSQYAARMYCKWLTAKTGRYYRLPTEAEWEYACRAGTTTAYSFGDDPDDLEDYGWYFDNCEDEAYAEVGRKKPNPWGLYDMHGNVLEWVLDQYVEDVHQQRLDGEISGAYVPVTERFPCVTRGGYYDDDPEMLRSAARLASDADPGGGWNMLDPQMPHSIWFIATENACVGLRVVRPLEWPSEEEALKIEPDAEIARQYSVDQAGKQ